MVEDVSRFLSHVDAICVHVGLEHARNPKPSLDMKYAAFPSSRRLAKLERLDPRPKACDATQRNGGRADGQEEEQGMDGGRQKRRIMYARRRGVTEGRRWMERKTRSLTTHPCRRLEYVTSTPEHVTHRHNTEQPPFAEIRDKSCAHNMGKRRLATVRSKIRRTTSRPTQSVDHSSEIRRRTRTVHQIAAIDKHVAATVHQKHSI